MKAYEIYGDPYAETVIVRIQGKHENELISEELALLEKRANAGWCIVAVPVDDWDNDLTPWRTEDAIPGREFGGNADKILGQIIDDIIPDYSSCYPNIKREYYIAGYSLAGLFALWAVHETDLFNGVAAMSPSLWYPGWRAYANAHEPQVQWAYLSLGNREHKAGKSIMSSVLEEVNAQHGLLLSRGIDTKLEINVGNHFKDVAERIAKGEAYIINKK